MSDAKPGTEQSKTILDLYFLDCSIFRPAHNIELVVFITVVQHENVYTSAPRSRRYPLLWGVQPKHLLYQNT